jgi:hypothetical protein
VRKTLEKRGDSPRPPRGLKRSSAALWRRIVDACLLSDAELEVLHGALVMLERAEDAAQVLKTEGMTIVDRYGTPKLHPACDLERQSRVAAARMFAQLNVKMVAGATHYGGKHGPKAPVVPLRAV